MTDSTYLPAIRSKVGDWRLYISTLSFDLIAKLIKAPDEVHERKRLSDWIQREAILPHEKSIASYIAENEQRFLGAIIVGVYGGSPDWAPLTVSFENNLLSIDEKQQEKVKDVLGFLSFTGKEKLFAIDGQHRVAGIKRAIEDNDNLAEFLSDEMSVIFVAHDASTIKGRERTRRLFTTVNKKAKPMSKTAIIALDEDNGFAVVTRRLIDEHWLFEDKREHISYTSTGSLHSSYTNAFTSVTGLYEIIMDFYPKDKRELGYTKKEFLNRRPKDEIVDKYLKSVREYLDALLTEVPSLKKVFVDGNGKANDFRKPGSNFLLFRPVGQRAFTKAVQHLMSRNISIKGAIKILKKVDMNLEKDLWHHILWDPVSKNMITTKFAMAETQLLVSAGQEPRNAQNLKNLNNLLNSQLDNT